MSNGDEKRARIIAEQALRAAAEQTMPRTPSRKPRSNWAASSSPARAKRPAKAPPQQS